MATKRRSKAARWAEAVAECQSAMEDIRLLQTNLNTALTSLYDVQQEYQDWLDNMPESMSSSATAEKLQEVCELDIESYMDEPLDNWSEVENTVSEAEGVDLPMGFGRD
jgi:hypothetical protein